MGRLSGIQYLRGIAASGVVVFHATDRVGAAWWPGASGVDLFFVISGFLMIAITSERTRPIGFLSDRALRIVPIYWLATTVMLLGGLAHLFPRMKLVPEHVVASYLFLPTRAPAGEIVPLLVQGWTLNLEVAFYLVFATLLGLRHSLRMLVLTAVFCGIVVAGLVMPHPSTAALFYSNPIILEFVMGGWLGVITKSRSDWPRWCGAPLLVGALLWLGLYMTGWLPVGRALGSGIAYTGLLASTIAIERRRALPAVNLLRILGDGSYSIYLWHTLALSVVVMAGRKAGLNDVATVLAATGAGIGAGVFCYYLIERPLMDKIAAWRRRRAARVLSADSA